MKCTTETFIYEESDYISARKMCFSEEQARSLIAEFNLSEECLVHTISETAGAIYDYGLEEFSEYKKRKQVAVKTLRLIAQTIEELW